MGFATAVRKDSRVPGQAGGENKNTGACFVTSAFIKITQHWIF